MTGVKAGIALGSNLGDRRAQIVAARDCVFSLHGDDEAPRRSELYETEPVDLLQKLRNYERGSGRAKDRAKNSPREIDLDLLYMGELRLDSSALVLPHPRMVSRRFVLQPLADIRADLVLPGQIASIAQLLSALTPEPAARIVTREW